MSDVLPNSSVQFQTAAGTPVVTFAAVHDGSLPGYVLAELDEIGFQRRRDTTESPYEDGEVEISSVRAAGRLRLTVQCIGSTGAQCRTARDALLAVAESRSWRLRIELDGVVDLYACRAADWSVRIRTGLLFAHRTDLTLTIPVQEI